MPVLSSIDFKARKRAARISLVTSVAVLSLKGFAYQQTNSTSILSDALESVVNVLTALVAMFVISYSAQPADEDHPYGHGKAEFFSSAFEGGLILFASVMIFLESISSFLGTSQLKDIETGIFYVGLATALNFSVGLYLRRIGNREKSETLLASGAHLLSDVKTTVVVIDGLLMVNWTGWTWFDGAVAAGLGVHLFVEGSRIVLRAFSGLIDATDNDSLEILSQLIRRYRLPGIIDIHKLRTLRSGSFHHIDAHLVVPEYWDVAKAHELTHHFEQQVVTEYPYDGEFAFHLDPCHRSYCRKCDLQECPIRVVPFEQLYSFSVSDLVQGPQKTNESHGSLSKT